MFFLDKELFSKCNCPQCEPAPSEDEDIADMLFDDDGMIASIE